MDLMMRRKALMRNKEMCLYKLPQPTTFNGSSDFIDTNVKLMEEDIDFSIELTFIQGEEGTNSYTGVFYCVLETAPYPGISIQRYQGQNRYCFGAAGNDNNRVLPVAYSPGSEIRMVIRKARGTGTRTLDASVNGVRCNRFSQSASWTSNKNNLSLLLGCCQGTNGAKFRFWHGTINDFKIRTCIVDDEYVNRYLSFT